MKKIDYVRFFGLLSVVIFLISILFTTTLNVYELGVNLFGIGCISLLISFGLFIIEINTNKLKNTKK